MNRTTENFALTTEVFALRAAVVAFMAGEARVLDDGREVRWDEPNCQTEWDRLVGIVWNDETQSWVPLVEAAV